MWSAQAQRRSVAAILSPAVQVRGVVVRHLVHHSVHLALVGGVEVLL